MERSDGVVVRQLIVPYTLDANDMRFVSPSGFANVEQFFTYLRDTFDVLYEEGAEAPKMMSIGMHNRLLGKPAHVTDKRAQPVEVLVESLERMSVGGDVHPFSRNGR